jgi:ssRNA-specific RNase YbeY (16S rRNA maturation enzyme)
LGYTHGSDGKASEMEALEKQVLKKLGIEDPYQIEL